MFKILVSMVISIVNLWTINACAVMPDKAIVKVIYKAAAEFQVDAQDLVRIAYTESKFKADAVRSNKNGTIDYGMFQVNSIHWTTTCKGMHVMQLRDNARCAAKILSSIKERYSDSDIQWLGRYHSKTPSKKAKYFQLLSAVNPKGVKYVQGH